MRYPHISVVAMTEENYYEWRNFAIGVAKLCSSKIMQNFYQRSHVLCSSKEMRSNDDGNLHVSMKINNADLVTQTDQDVENTIRSMIHQRYPYHQFIGEESITDSTGRLVITDSPTWVVDPIDGTMNFVHKYPGFCISIGILHQKKPVVGVVFDVLDDRMYSAVTNHGASCNGIPLKCSSCNKIQNCLILTETTARRDPESIKDLTRNMSNLLNSKIAAIRMTGSAALNICRVAEGSADAYFEFGPHIWDVAAAAVILQEAGGHLLGNVNNNELGDADLTKREFLAVGSDLELAKLISPLLLSSCSLDSD